MFDRILFASLPALFSLTLFLSAGLLFIVEPMIAKLILPLFGGTPAVWNTCMMFFQVMLLAGYGYAHVSGTKVGLNRQIVLHLAILVAACLVIPITIPRQWGLFAGGSPVGAILLLLLGSVGLPFLVLSSTAPLLQQWFARTGHPSANDPYFLYSASNLGSMLALISYPTWIEPHFRLAGQSRSWAVGYLIVLALSLLCAGVTRKYMPGCIPRGKGPEEPPAASCVTGDTRLTYGERGRWVLLAFVPSSLMLGVTTFLSTDIAAIPLFWIIPLSLYLLSFIIVFARVPISVHKASMLLMPISLAALIFVNYSDIDIPKWIVFLFHLVNFFLYCMVCHGEIARTRPAKEHLTEFYLWLSVGGMLGGIFNSLIAPVTFNTVLEYPLILIIGAILLPAGGRERLYGLRNWKSLLLYFGVPLLLVPLTYLSTTNGYLRGVSLSWLTDLLHIAPKTFDLFITYGIPVLLCYGLVFLKRPFLFGIGIAALLLTVVVSKDFKRDIVHRERSFFGVLTVTRDYNGAFMNLSHGTTLHGKQWLNEYNRHEPVSYYHRKGPVGQVFSAFKGKKRKNRIAVTGLGTGSIAAYAGRGQEIDFYEIDPAVKKISTDPAYFTFLSDCRAEWEVILGDARLTMEKAPPHYYDIIILDAFSSDSIPVHLLTKEAVDLYFSKLTREGVLLIHITNRYVDLAPVLAKLAEENGFAARLCDDGEDYEIGKDGSTWVLLAKTESNLGKLSRKSDWTKIETQKGVPVWTDDFSNLLSVFKW
ncbi:MAG: fused MFS/spermidine synthase [Deltaproteobacteria bacterium]|nr:fused MFS/spermidine synthase [Deltaproteobacteria bacterium]